MVSPSLIAEDALLPVILLSRSAGLWHFSGVDKDFYLILSTIAKNDEFEEFNFDPSMNF